MKSLTLQLAAVLSTATLARSYVVESPRSNSNNFELLILHNNDMHARFAETSQLSGACTLADKESGKCYGGFARIAHVVNEARRAAATGETPPVLYLNAGDTYTGTVWFTLYKWKIAAELVNALHPDTVCLGNHEFDNGISGLTPFIESLNCPVLAANLILDKVPELANQTNLKKSTIFDISGTKVGIIGYLTPKTKLTSNRNDVEFIDEITAIQEEVNIMKSENIKIIIALGHSGYKKDLEIAEKVIGLDLVIGAHSHYLLWNGVPPDTEKSEGPYPTFVTQRNGKRVPVVQAYAYTKYLGRLYMLFGTDGQLIDFNGRPIILDESIPQDPIILKIIERYSHDAYNITNKVIGETYVALEGNCKLKECNLGNLITDAMVYCYADKYVGEHLPDSLIAVIQAGGIRASIVHPQNPFNITFEDLLTVLPFGGNLVAVSMNGSVLIQMLEYSVTDLGSLRMRKFLQYSGLRVTFDFTKPDSRKVVKVLAKCWKCDVPQYFKVEPNEMYKVLMSKFLFRGGDGYFMFEGLPVQELPYGEMECTQHYITKYSPVFPQVEGRINIISQMRNQIEYSFKLHFS